jgi:virginiamycin B lyase
VAALLILAAAPAATAQQAREGRVIDTPIPWSQPDAERPRLRVRHVQGDGMAHHRAPSAAPGGSTHEIAFDERRGGDLWISGQTWDSLVRVTPRGTAMRFVPMPPGSGPHGLAFDSAGRLWVTLEYSGRVRALDAATGRVLADHDVRLHCTSCPERINSHPHGLAIGPDGETVWFTGKATGTVGRISPGGEVSTFALETVGSVPIYIRAGPDGNMWVTELVGNAIARVTPEGEVEEFPIPTPNSRPIAIVPGPDGAMWFSEEAGNKVGRIDRQGRIVEFPVPKASPNAILAGLAFDREGNLWVQQYSSPGSPPPESPPVDHIVRIDREALAAGPDRLSSASFTFYPVPTRETVMHRIIQGPDGAMWFTEMRADRVGRVIR